jgi:hypothetical protein
MTIAGSLALIILGAVLRYAVTWRSNLVDIGKLGAILIIGGVLGLLASVASQYARRRARARSRF